MSCMYLFRIFMEVNNDIRFRGELRKRDHFSRIQFYIYFVSTLKGKGSERRKSERRKSERRKSKN
jgi:hypothetical protein